MLWKQDRAGQPCPAGRPSDDGVMEVSYLGEGWLDFAVFIPPARKKSVRSEKSEQQQHRGAISASDFVSDSQQDALSSL